MSEPQTLDRRSGTSIDTNRDIYDCDTPPFGLMAIARIAVPRILIMQGRGRDKEVLLQDESYLSKPRFHVMLLS